MLFIAILSLCSFLWNPPAEVLIGSAQKLPSSYSKLSLPVVTAVISEAAQLQREVSLVLSLCSQAIFPMLLFYYFILFVVPVILPGQRGKEI